METIHLNYNSYSNKLHRLQNKKNLMFWCVNYINSNNSSLTKLKALGISLGEYILYILFHYLIVNE